MLIRPLFLAFATVFMLSACTINVHSAGGQPEFHEQQLLELNALEVKELTVQTGAGKLNITGVQGLTHISVEAQIYRDEADEVVLTLDRDGDTAELIASIDSGLSWGNSPYIDLDIKVPASLLLKVEDGSGDIHIKGMKADIELDDGSGSIVIEGGHKIKLNDGSGSINISRTSGEMKINDGSGSITISQTAGTIVINDGSGDMELTDVKGDLNIEDGSGDIEISDIDGVVTLDDGSGDIEVNRAKGLNIIETGSGDISFDEIDGRVSME